jgi:peptidoglycan/LPS O-acetylase OafA/YrhL
MTAPAHADGCAIEAVRVRQDAFQPEIQGLRALSVLAVIWGHSGLPGLPGGFTGVDVFFVISGFLITRLLLKEMAATGRIDLLGFWTRRARRLLPNAYATLIGTLLLALFLFPGYSPGHLVRDVVFAALEIANFRFAARAVDYFQSEGPASPVLHFWSLNVEEQFYLFWPLLLTGIGLLWRGHRRRRIILALALIWCASFGASAVLTFTEQPIAYFSTGTRCWQLATGALLAAGWRSIEELPRLLRVIIAWGGLSAILLGMAAIDEGALYPGVLALLPALGAAALIAGFDAAKPDGLLRRGLGSRLMQWIGERSYSWYLWHWPLLALPRATFHDTPYIAAIALPASLIAACLAYSWLETPVRHSPKLAGAPWVTLAGATAGLGLIMIAGYAYLPVLSAMDRTLAARIEQIETASQDIARVTRANCLQHKNDVDPSLCEYGAPDGRYRVALVGDSHANHWSPALDAAAKQAGWRVTQWTKASCTNASVTIYAKERGLYTSCDQWRENVLRSLTEIDIPDLVILSDRVNYGDQVYDPALKRILSGSEGQKLWKDGFRKTIQRLLDAGVRVVVMRDVPRMPRDYRACLLTESECPIPRASALGYPPLEAEVAREFPDRVTFVDFSDRICDAGHCPAMRNGLIVYQNTSHLTATYAATFAPQMAEVLRGFERILGAADRKPPLPDKSVTSDAR